MKNLLDKLCLSVYKKQFHKAENAILSFVGSTLKGKKTNEQIAEAIILTGIIYDDFNEYYASWYQKLFNKSNMPELKTSKHPNYLIDHCKRIAEMDDLLYELNSYLTCDQSPERKKEVQYHLNCYKKSHRPLHFSKENASSITKTSFN